MAGTNKFDMILIVRNDSTTAWKDGTYRLEKGELGIGYLSNGNVIVKCGEVDEVASAAQGTTVMKTWANCPQVEGVFESNPVLTYNFGRYTTTNGYVETQGEGMTTSQWLIHCLAETKEPTISQPSYTLSASTITTNTSNKEIGSKVTKLAWGGTWSSGSYEYGSKIGDTKYTDTGTGITVSYVVSRDGNSIGTSLSGTHTLTNPIVIGSTSATNLGKIACTCTWSASPRTPVNNIGVATSGQIAGGSTTQEVSYSITGYREGCFYGTVTTANFNKDMITSAVVRGLSKKLGANYSKKDNLAYTVPSGATAILIAVPEGKTGPTSVLNTTVNAEMFGEYDADSQKYGNFGKVTISVGGADATATSVGSYATNYDVYYFIPANAYSSTAALQIDLGA